MRGAAREDNQPLANYTLMPTHMVGFFDPEELTEATLHDGFDFTSGYKLLRTPGGGGSFELNTSRLFDLDEDYEQKHPIVDAEVEDRLCREMVRLMLWNDAPKEQLTRVGLETYS